MVKILQLMNWEASLVALCNDGTLWEISLPNKAGIWSSCRHSLLEGKAVYKETLLSEIDLAPRIIHVLEKAGIQTLKQLVALTAKQLAEVPLLGDKSVFEIQNLLPKIGYSLSSAAR